MRIVMLVAVVTLLLLPPPQAAAEWLHRVPLVRDTAIVDWPAAGRRMFLRFGAHSYEPLRAETRDGRQLEVVRGQTVVIAPFQDLVAVPWQIVGQRAEALVRIERPATRDTFWDQVLEVDPDSLGALPRYRVVESGTFGSALPGHVRSIDFTPAEIEKQQGSLTDPVISQRLSREIPWSELESKALPLDFQKVLLASPHDGSPAFAFQNGQWITTWPSDAMRWRKEDHWFAPALLIGDTLIRPAPLSASTSFLKTADGRTLPCWTLAWSYQGITVLQEMFSVRVPAGKGPCLWVRFRIGHAPPHVRLALGMGRRLNVHYWDDNTLERTPIPFFTMEPRYRPEGSVVLDAQGKAVLISANPFTIELLGPVEMLAVFSADKKGNVVLQTPQNPDTGSSTGISSATFTRAKKQFIREWSARLRTGAQAQLPSSEWMERIDAWHSQVESITRVKYQGKERLSYGAYFYQAYFGIEEAWPVVALALWGCGDEAQRQAAIMLEPENLSKDNVHHQSRNGAGPAAAAAVARLTNDGRWLASVAPAMIDCARWTERACRQDNESRSPVTRGLLPPHIYGGDVRDPATSLYATAACWHGMAATGDALEALGSPGLVREGRDINAAARTLYVRLSEVVQTVADQTSSPPFLPLALELPSLGGKNEGPHPRITATRLGNYWNLFGPSFLELDFRGGEGGGSASDWIFDYEQAHGGLWAGLPRFYNGLDAAYAIGNISYLVNRGLNDSAYRLQALASLQSFMLHAASRNGFTIPEVAGLFPSRLNDVAYERLVREAPWSFGMYDAGRYLEGDIPFTEPLGAAAGEGLWLIRRALVSETFDENGRPDGGLLLLPCVPSRWLAEGREIRLRNFPTYYGTISMTVRSSISSHRKIAIEFRFVPFKNNTSSLPLRFRVRLSPPGERLQEITFVPNRMRTVRIVSNW
jgi:hypothetical protein